MPDFKEYEAEYKNCLKRAKDFKPSDISKMANEAKNWRYDAVQALKALPELVGKIKGQEPEYEKIKAIVDFSKVKTKEGKDVKKILRYIEKCQKNQVEAASGLASMGSGAFPAELGLTKLQKDITRDLKKEKNSKPDKKIVKLQKQIESDLKDISTLKKVVKLNTDPEEDNKKYFVKALAMKATANKETKETKKLADKLSAKKLKGNYNAGLNTLKTMDAHIEKLAELLNKLPSDNKAKKEINLLVSEFKVKREEIYGTASEYTTMQKKNKEDIKGLADSKKIEKAFKKYDSAIKNQAVKLDAAVKNKLKEAGLKSKA